MSELPASARRFLLRVQQATDERGWWTPKTRRPLDRDHRWIKNVGLIENYGTRSYRITQAGRNALANSRRY